MADKEYLLGNKARELLRYTNHATRVVSEDVSRRDAREIFKRIAQLEDIRDVRDVCSEVIHTVDCRDREGFTKSAYRLYGEEMRVVARSILRDIQSANNKHFATGYRERIRKIDDVLDGCAVLLEFIQICVDEHIISTRKAGIWTGKVNDVFFMTKSWRKNDGARARKLEGERQQEADRRQIELTKTAIQQVKQGK